MYAIMSWFYIQFDPFDLQEFSARRATSTDFLHKKPDTEVSG